VCAVRDTLFGPAVGNVVGTPIRSGRAAPCLLISMRALEENLDVESSLLRYDP
jgi:hypothetical protein